MEDSAVAYQTPRPQFRALSACAITLLTVNKAYNQRLFTLFEWPIRVTWDGRGKSHKEHLPRNGLKPSLDLYSS